MFGFSPLAKFPIPDDFDRNRSAFPAGVEGKAGVQSDAILKVTVASATSGSGNRFYIDGVENPVLNLKRGTKYIFDVSDSTNIGHPLRFKDSSGASYLTNVIITGIQGNPGATVEITVAENAPDSLRYYCTIHGNGMGNTITVANFLNILTEANVSVTGISATGSVGEARFVHLFDVTGVEGTGQAGSANVALGQTILPTGLQANSGLGSPDLSLGSSFEVTGVQAEVVLGIPIRFETVEITTGVEASASVGTAEAGLILNVPVTGVSGTLETNSVQVINETNVSPSSVFGTGEIGSVSITGIANLDITGVQGQAQTADLNGVVLNIIYPVDGVGSNASIGNVSVSASANFSVGSVSASMFIDQVVMYSSINFAELNVPLAPFDAVDLVEDENVPIDDVYVELPENLAEEDFSEETSTLTDNFLSVEIEQANFLDTNPTDGEPTEDIYSQINPENDVPSDPYSGVTVSVNNNPYTDLGDDLSNTSYNNVDVNVNTVYTDEEINQEDFEGGEILDAA